MYFRPEFRKLITWIFKRLACRRQSKKPWSSTGLPQRSHASHSQASRDQEVGAFSTSKVTNGHKSAVIGGTYVSHSNSVSAMADVLKDNQQKIQQISNEKKTTGDNVEKERCNQAMSDEQTPKRLIRFFSEVAQREDSAITITDDDKPTSP